MSILISCEVGGDRVPIPLIGHSQITQPPQKSTQRERLKPGHLPSRLTHDAAARYASRRMAQQLHAPLIENDYSFDLIDVTRSVKHRQLFPALTRSWPRPDRKRLVEQVHAPYRERVREAVAQTLVKFPYAVHLSLRSFAWRHQGKVPRADAGLLYDPANEAEADLCLDWVNEMYETLPMLKVRRNYPRRGTIDSITKAMRVEFQGQHYLGIEVVLNRAWAGRRLAIRDEVIDGICQTLAKVTQTQQIAAA